MQFVLLLPKPDREEQLCTVPDIKLKGKQTQCLVLGSSGAPGTGPAEGYKDDEETGATLL